MSFLAVAFVGCKDEVRVGEVDLGYLKLVSSDVNFGYQGGSGDIVVDTQETVEATVPLDGQWAELTINRNVVTVTVAAYGGLETRNTSVTLSAGGRSVVVPVSQTSSALELGIGSLSFGKLSGTQVVAVNVEDVPVDVAVSATTLAADAIAAGAATRAGADLSWLRAEFKEKEGVVISVENNPGGVRKAYVRVNFGTLKKEIEVLQSTALTSATAKLDFAYAESTKEMTFDVTPGVAVTASSNVPWVTATVSGSTAAVTVLRSNTSDVRNAVLTLSTAAGAKLEVAVAQTPQPLYRTAGLEEGEGYYGDFYENGTNSFVFFLTEFQPPRTATTNGYDFSFDLTTIAVDASPSKQYLDIPAGTYTIGEAGVAGKVNANGSAVIPVVDGVYDFYGLRVFTGGTVKISKSGENYTISLDVTFEGYFEAIPEEEFHARYIGPMQIPNPNYDDGGGQDEPGPFEYGDILGNYSGAGTPNWWPSSGPSTWAGRIAQPSNGSTEYCVMTASFGVNINAKIDVDVAGETLYMDNYTVIAETSDGGYEGFLTGFFVDGEGENRSMYFLNKGPKLLELPWDPVAKTITFPAQINVGDPFGVKTMYYGIGAFATADGSWGGSFTDMYNNVVLTVSSGSGVAALSGTPVDAKASILERFGKTKQAKIPTLKASDFVQIPISAFTARKLELDTNSVRLPYKNNMYR